MKWKHTRGGHGHFHPTNTEVPPPPWVSLKVSAWLSAPLQHCRARDASCVLTVSTCQFAEPGARTWTCMSLHVAYVEIARACIHDSCIFSRQVSVLFLSDVHIQEYNALCVTSQPCPDGGLWDSVWSRLQYTVTYTVTVQGLTVFHK